jgi:hypothetical protein
MVFPLKADGQLIAQLPMNFQVQSNLQQPPQPQRPAFAPAPLTDSGRPDVVEQPPESPTVPVRPNAPQATTPERPTPAAPPKRDPDLIRAGEYLKVTINGVVRWERVRPEEGLFAMADRLGVDRNTLMRENGFDPSQVGPAGRGALWTPQEAARVAALPMRPQDVVQGTVAGLRPPTNGSVSTTASGKPSPADMELAKWALNEVNTPGSMLQAGFSSQPKKQQELGLAALTRVANGETLKPEELAAWNEQRNVLQTLRQQATLQVAGPPGGRPVPPSAPTRETADSAKDKQLAAKIPQGARLTAEQRQIVDLILNDKPLTPDQSAEWGRMKKALEQLPVQVTPTGVPT